LKLLVVDEEHQAIDLTASSTGTFQSVWQPQTLTTSWSSSFLT